MGEKPGPLAAEDVSEEQLRVEAWRRQLGLA
jgi:hypothetical protein